MKYLGPPQSGSQAGTTASHNRAGQYFRNRRSPVQPVGTGRRAFIRSAFGSGSSAWAGLTDSDRASWSSFADSHPVTDSLGQSIKLTGQQMFVGVFTQDVNVGGITPPDVPSTTSVFTPAITAFTFVHTTTPALTLTLDGGGAADAYALIAFSRPVGAGVSFMKTYWQCKVVAGDDSSVTGLLALYEAQFGLPPVGSRVFVKVTPVNADFWTGTPITKSTVVP
jgi:hypothetical protein